MYYKWYVSNNPCKLWGSTLNQPMATDTQIDRHPKPRGCICIRRILGVASSHLWGMMISSIIRHPPVAVGKFISAITVPGTYPKLQWGKTMQSVLKPQNVGTKNHSTTLSWSLFLRESSSRCQIRWCGIRGKCHHHHHHRGHPPPIHGPSQRQGKSHS